MPRDESAAEGAAPGRVLIVDDHAPNRLLIRDLLEAQGHTVHEASDGPSALVAAEGAPPDVVLLDVQMPGMDGFEVCRRLKSSPATAGVPVLLVTALSAREDRLTGISAGANDFVTKPIDSTDLMLRVRNAIRMRQLHVRVELQYRELRELERLRDELVHMVAHDLRSPLAAVHAILEMLQMDESLSPGEHAEFLADARRLTNRVADMISDLLDVSRLEAGRMPVDARRLELGALAADAAGTAYPGSARIVYEPARAPVEVVGDVKLLARVMINLVDNAVKFTPKNGTVRIGVLVDDRGAVVTVTDEGPGVPVDVRQTIFEKYSQAPGVAQPRRSTGLGLTFCKLAVDAHRGRIGVEDAPGHGAEFWFALPLAGPDAPAIR